MPDTARYPSLGSRGPRNKRTILRYYKTLKGLRRIIRSQVRHAWNLHVALASVNGDLEVERRAHRLAVYDLDKLIVKYRDLREATKKTVVRAVVIDEGRAKEVLFEVPDAFFESIRDMGRLCYDEREQYARRVLQQIVSKTCHDLFGEKSHGPEYIFGLLAEVARHPELALRDRSFHRAICAATGVPEPVVPTNKQKEAPRAQAWKKSRATAASGAARNSRRRIVTPASGTRTRSTASPASTAGSS